MIAHTNEIVYTCGFAMDPEAMSVVLIKKDRGPSFNVGKWNGVGGKVERGEGIRSCMSREFHEETGLLIPPLEWSCFHIEKHLARAEQTRDVRIHFMVAKASLAQLQKTTSMTSESVGVYSFLYPAPVPDNYVYNMWYLLPMALCWLTRPDHRWIEG